MSCDALLKGFARRRPSKMEALAEAILVEIGRQIVVSGKPIVRSSNYFLVRDSRAYCRVREA